MTGEKLPPNELADLYEALFTVLESLPEETHPAWEFAIESILFGGTGLAAGIASYGEQQADRNEFKISDYRAQYGDGERVIEFPTLTTHTPLAQDRQYLNDEIQLPVTPESEKVLPLFVDEDSFTEAISLLNEFPAELGADTAGSGESGLLNPSRFPGLSTTSTNQQSPQNSRSDEEDESAHHTDIPPNELADLYEGLYLVLDLIPEKAHPKWREAIETIVFGGEHLRQGASAYGEQQAERNEFGMPEYRAEYGDGDHVTDFPTLTTGPPADSETSFVEGDIQLPVAPVSEAVLPLVPDSTTLKEALSLLEEFPAEPQADSPGHGIDSLLDIESLVSDVELEDRLVSSASTSEAESPSPSASEPESTPSQSGSTEGADPPTQSKTNAKPSASTSRSESTSTSGKEVLRREQAGESTVPPAEDINSSADSSRKYEDPRAERAHRRAQQRDPSDVVELGEEISLVLKEADYSSRPPTIMGTKNRLVVFVTDTPQDLSQHDSIRAKVIDYGGKNNSAEAVFVGYND